MVLATDRYKNFCLWHDNYSQLANANNTSIKNNCLRLKSEVGMAVLKANKQE